jgi:nitrogen fixation protein NifU and related proteins
MAHKNSQNTYQQVILERNKTPRHRGTTSRVDRCQKGYSPTCGDTIELTLQLTADGGQIEAVKHEGAGCAISIASADLMADVLTGKTIEEAISIMQRFQKLMYGKEEFSDGLGKLIVLQGVAKFPVRIKCAMLPWYTLSAALSGVEDRVDLL